MKLTSTNPAWKRSVRIMRVACLGAVGCAILLAALAWSSGRYEMMAVDAFCGGVCSVLAWINWRLFSI